MTRREMLAQAAIPYLDKRGADVRPGAAGAAEIRLPYLPVGFFGPADAAHAAGGAIYMGVQLALEDAAGKSAKPFRLFSRWADDPWRAGASAVVKLAYDDSVVAVIGGIDSATTHLAEQVAAKALFPLVDPVNGDETANGAGVPWVFSFAPGDSLYAGAMGAELKGKPYTLLAATDHGSRQLARALVRIAQPAERHDFAPPGLPPAPAHELVVVLAPGRSSAEVARTLPAGTRIMAGPQAHARVFQQLNARRVVAPAPARLDAELAQRLRARFSYSGDAFTQLAYDSTALLLRCMLEAGPNRAELRERLAPHFKPNGRRTISSVLLQEISPS
jgi:ABC-type branched-subunit amino acid transport system substrate-binding protein